MVQAVTKLVEQRDHFIVSKTAPVYPFTGRLKLRVR